MGYNMLLHTNKRSLNVQAELEQATVMNFNRSNCPNVSRPMPKL